MEREYIIAVLEDTGWRLEGRAGAASILGLSPSPAACAHEEAGGR
ncbi:MAG: helix-turn-helix domain-containing protein [Gemmatimonadaceae bacterium]